MLKVQMKTMIIIKKKKNTLKSTSTSNDKMLLKRTVYRLSATDPSTTLIDV